MKYLVNLKTKLIIIKEAYTKYITWRQGKEFERRHSSSGECKCTSYEYERVVSVRPCQNSASFKKRSFFGGFVNVYYWAA